MSSNQINDARRLLTQGNKKQAFSILKEIVKTNPQNADAWWLIASNLDDPVKKQKTIRKLLTIQPEHQEAKNALKLLSTRQTNSGSTDFSKSALNRDKHRTPEKSKRKSSPNFQIKPVYIASLSMAVGFVVLVAILYTLFSTDNMQPNVSLDATYRYDPPESLLQSDTENITEYFTVDYPQDWFFDILASNHLYASSSEDLNSRISEIDINLYSKTEHEQTFSSNNTMQALENYHDGLTGVEQGRFGQDSASLFWEDSRGTSRFRSVYHLILDEGDIMIHVFVYMFEGNFEDYRDVIFGLIDSMEYHPN